MATEFFLKLWDNHIIQLGVWQTVYMTFLTSLFAYVIGLPLGVLLFILKSIDKNAEKEEKAAAQAQADYRSDLGPAPAQTAPRQETEPTYGHDVPTKEQKDAKERHKLLTTLCTIGGAVFLFAGFSTLFMDDADSMMEAFTAIAQMLGGQAQVGLVPLLLLAALILSLIHI